MGSEIKNREDLADKAVGKFNSVSAFTVTRNIAVDSESTIAAVKNSKAKYDESVSFVSSIQSQLANDTSKIMNINKAFINYDSKMTRGISNTFRIKK